MVTTIPAEEGLAVAKLGKGIKSRADVSAVGQAGIGLGYEEIIGGQPFVEGVRESCVAFIGMKPTLVRGILPELNGNKVQQSSRCGDTTAICVVDGMNLAVVAAGHLLLKVELLLAVWYTELMHEVLLLSTHPQRIRRGLAGGGRYSLPLRAHLPLPAQEPAGAG